MSRFRPFWLALALLAACAPAPPSPPVLGLTAQFGTLARTHGLAVPLPGGLVLTAAHVVDEASLREEFCRLGRWPGPELPYLTGLELRLADGSAVAATRLRLGRSTFRPVAAPAVRPGRRRPGRPLALPAQTDPCDLAYRHGEDLALLRPAEPLPGEPPPVCAEDPAPGQEVRVATAAGVLAARLAGEVGEADAANGRYAVLARRLESGDSGGGVFAAESGCLLGIVAMRDPAAPEHSWLVRAAVIRDFLKKE